MRKGGTSSAPTTPKGGNGRGGNAQPTQLAEEHHIVATTFVQADVNTFRELVQKLTGGPPSPLPTTPTSELSNGKESTSTPVRREPIPGQPVPERIMSVKPVGGPGPQRTSTAKLFERRQNAKKLEVKQLMGPHILKRTISPALSPVSPLTNDVFSEQSSGATSPLGYMGYSPVPRPSFDLEQPPTATSPGFDLNSGIIQLELERPRNRGHTSGTTGPSRNGSYELNICQRKIHDVISGFKEQPYTKGQDRTVLSPLCSRRTPKNDRCSLVSR